MSTGLIGGGTTARSPLAIVAAVAALVAAVLACYLPTPGDYWISYDNPQMIQLESRTRALTLEGSARASALLELATTPHHDLYQPLASLSWAIDYALFGWDRAGFHAHSVALHIGVVVALFFLALRLSDSVLAAFLASLLCGVHPVMVQSVCWTISRTSSLAAVWILIGCHFQLGYARKPGNYPLLALSTLAFAISMTAKPLPSIIFLPLLLDLWVRRPFRKLVLLESLPLAAVAIALTLVNLQISNSFAGEASIVRPWLEVLQRAPASFALATANTFWPSDLALYYGYDLAPALIGWRWLAVAAATAIALASGVVLWRRGERGVLLSLCAFGLFLAPQIASIRYRDILTADRYVYVPLLFIALGVASLLAHLLRDGAHPQRIALRRGTIALALLAAVILAVQTRTESRTWSDEEGLWQRVIGQTPAPLPYLALCKLYSFEGRTHDALAACIEAQALASVDRYASKDVVYPFHLARQARLAGEEWKASTATGSARNATRDFDLAVTSAQQATARWPARIDLRYELGRSQLAAGEARLAVATFDELLALEPGDEPSISYLGIALFESGELVRALEVLEARPMGDPTRYDTLAQIYAEQGRHTLSAKANLAWARAIPGDSAAHEAFRNSALAAEAAGQGERVAPLRELYRRLHGEALGE